MTTPTVCADCGGFCTSRSAPPRCWECRRRDQAGEFWSTDVLTDGEWRPTGPGGVLQWQEGAQMQASAPGLTPADVAKMIACPTCRARVDQMCRTTTGRTRSPHPTRLVIKRCPCGEPINPGRKVCDDCRAEARRINGRNGMRATRARRQAIRQAAA